MSDDEFNTTFLSDLKETALGWLDSLTDPLERAKAIVSRMHRTALLRRVSRVTCHRLDKEGKQLLRVLQKEIESVPEGVTDISTSNRLRVLETAVEHAEKMGVYTIPKVTDLNKELEFTKMDREDARWRDLVRAIEKMSK